MENKFIEVYPVFRLEAIGNILSGTLEDGKKIKSFKPFYKRNTETNIIETVEEVPEDFNNELLDKLDLITKDMNMIFGRVSKDTVEVSDMNNVFIKYINLLPLNKRRFLRMVSMPDTYMLLDYLKMMINTDIEAGGVISKVTDPLMIESMTDQANYRDPEINTTLVVPDFKPKGDGSLEETLVLRLYYNIPIIKGKDGKVRYLSFRVDME